MNLRLKANDLILKTLVGISLTLIVSHAQGQDEFDFELPTSPPPAAEPELHAATDSDLIEDHRDTNDLVELHVPLDYDSPYKQRRGTHGFMFGLNYTNIMFDKYVSVLDNTTFYQELFGETEFPLVEVNLSYKYNFALGALTANLGMGQGSITDNPQGLEEKISVTKYGASASLILDNVFDEPYVAPYGTFGVMRLALNEQSGENSFSGNIDMLFQYQFGVLIQLDWLDSTFSKTARGDYGLENTYLDVFISKYEPSSDENDPDTSTDYSYGAGLRLEF